MKTLLATAFASLLLCSLGAHAGTPLINLSVGGEISPGVYGQVQFGNGPPPPVLYAQPIIIVHQSSDADEEPLYLLVPPGHAKHWSKHCREYNACNRPVYFVKSPEYEPGYRSHRDMRHRDEEREDEDHSDEDHREEHRDEGHGDEGRRGKGHRD